MESIFSSNNMDKPFFLAVGIVQTTPCVRLPSAILRHASRANSKTVDSPPRPSGRSLGRQIDGEVKRRLEISHRRCLGKSPSILPRVYLMGGTTTSGRVPGCAGKAVPMRDNTIVVLWSDHGYHQGEKRSFRKFSLWEEATHVPFIIYDPRPGKNEIRGIVPRPSR